MGGEQDDLGRVGYRRPPIAHRFRPGVSGNPKGRPKGSPTVQDLMAREAKRLVKIKTADGIVAIPKLEALVRKIYGQALEGDLAATRLIVQCIGGLGESPSGNLDEEVIEPMKVSDEALKRMLARFEGLFAEEEAQ